MPRPHPPNVEPPIPAAPAPSHDWYSRQILDAVERGHTVSQRSLARELGIALGLTNLLVKRLARKGFMRVIRIKPNRVRYLITPAGIAEKGRMSRDYFQASVQFYREARDRIRQQFAALSETWPENGPGPRSKRVVFYGAGEVAEIGYICLGDTDLTLVGVVDGEPRQSFFGLAVHPPARFSGLTLDGQPFDRLVVMSFSNPDTLSSAISELGVPPDRVAWL